MTLVEWITFPHLLKCLKILDQKCHFSAIHPTKWFWFDFVSQSTVPGAPPRRVEVEVLNSTALKVMWRSLTPGKQHGQIRGYQVHYVRVENGESRGHPLIKDVMLADAQVWPSVSFIQTSHVNNIVPNAVCSDLPLLSFSTIVRNVTN